MRSFSQHRSWLFAVVVFLAPLAVGYVVPHHERIVSGLGLLSLASLAWILGSNRRIVPWRVVVGGLALQLLMGFIILSPGVQQFFFTIVDGGIQWLSKRIEKGPEFLFQTLAPHTVLDASGKMPIAVTGRASPGIITFATWVLSSIVVYSAFLAVLFHIGLLPRLVALLARAMHWTMRISGAEALSTAANIVLGQSEAPLAIKPFMPRLTRSELFCIMLGGFANTAGTVLAAYVMILKNIPGIAGHLVTSSLISAPATLVVAKLMFPETEEPETGRSVPSNHEKLDANFVDALVRGAQEGFTLAINVGTMLLVFVAAAAVVDGALSAIIPLYRDAAGWHVGYGGTGFSLSVLLGWLFTPLAAIIGVPISEVYAVGQLLGTKTVFTEFMAYMDLGTLMSGDHPLSPRTAVIASYALCGFANIASIGIQIGAFAFLTGKNHAEISPLAIRAMFGGMLATLMTACIAGIFT